ncbi:hypothetical protein NDU88_002567 [Pleurodeles waltl]|uniref:Uncharacterized protein n=1 Tax=Pleurodeles waltl TaxID=8319 RepID=A0AAV7VET4_PLEWA|nr:hypothetical protein NDU88_002567 [Pleurodeles waltl]
MPEGRCHMLRLPSVAPPGSVPLQPDCCRRLLKGQCSARVQNGPPARRLLLSRPSLPELPAAAPAALKHGLGLHRLSAQADPSVPPMGPLSILRTPGRPLQMEPGAVL